MLDLIFGDGAILFGIPAVLGTLVFSLQLFLMLTGVGDLFDLGADVDIDLEFDADTGVDAFKVLSLQTIVAFLLGFGWGGLIGFRGFEWGLPLSAGLGVASGIGSVWLLAWAMGLMLQLQGSGNININEIVGREGVVYASVPPRREGRGQVKVVLDSRQRIYNAMTEGEGIPSHTKVTVTRVNGDNTLTVTRVG